MSSGISLLHQAGLLRSYFPGSSIIRRGDGELIWEGYLQPSALSIRYKIRLVYARNTGVDVFVISPRLSLAAAATKLPHVYSSTKQHLCLYYPADREWHPGMYFAKSIIPWAAEWLYYYELWIVTDGLWLGGGIQHG